MSSSPPSVEDDPYQVYLLRHPAERSSSVVPQLPTQPAMAETRLRYRRIAADARSGSVGSLGTHFPARFQFPQRNSLLESLTSDDEAAGSFAIRRRKSGKKKKRKRGRKKDDGNVDVVAMEGKGGVGDEDENAENIQVMDDGMRDVVGCLEDGRKVFAPQVLKGDKKQNFVLRVEEPMIYGTDMWGKKEDERELSVSFARREGNDRGGALQKLIRVLQWARRKSSNHKL